MKNIFAVICHELSPSLVYTVKKLASDKSNIVLIHVDLKTQINYFSFLSSDNIILIDKRLDVKWGHVSQIDAMLVLLEISLQYDFKYFSLISGDCVLTKSTDYIAKLFQEPDVEYIAFQDNNSGIDPALRLKNLYHKHFWGKQKSLSCKLTCKYYSLLYRLGMHQNPYMDSLPPLHKGTNWFSITQKTVVRVMDFVKKNETYHQAFKQSICGDEVFFHTIIGNLADIKLYQASKTKHLPAKALRYIDWFSGPEFPKILSEADFNNIIQSNCIFARKFSKQISVEQLIKVFG